MRLLLGFLGLILLTAATPVRDWSTVATKMPGGVYVIGNPAARVKLIEYASYTCSHCAEFSKASEPVLKQRMIRSGSTSLEFRNMIRDRLDLAAAILARCAGPRGFAAMSGAIFADQDNWLPRGADYEQANGARLGIYPRMSQLKSYADGAGLTALARGHGLGDAAIAACFADEAEADRVLAITAAAPASVNATPTFFLNGKQQANVRWPELEPLLRAQGAK